MVRTFEVLQHECPYHLGKANVVANDLSRMTMGSVSNLEKRRNNL